MAKTIGLSNKGKECNFMEKEELSWEGLLGEKQEYRVITVSHWLCC